METLSNILAWKIPWREEPGGYSPRGHKRQTPLSMHTGVYFCPLNYDKMADKRLSCIKKESIRIFGGETVMKL